MRRWCAVYVYEGVTEIVVANRGADLGLNLYFVPAVEDGENHQVGVRLSAEQAEALYGLLGTALANYYSDNRTMTGGCYSCKARPQVDPPRPESPAPRTPPEPEEPQESGESPMAGS
jgi:hypothetical protein